MSVVIYKAINNVMTECGAITKNKKNIKQGFMYRGIDDVMNALQPAMIKHNIFVVPEVLEQHREIRTTANGGVIYLSVLKIKYTFFAEDGSSVSCTVIGEAMDTADKASNKAMSVAFKYACFQTFCIPTEEMLDPDADTPPPTAPTPMTADTKENLFSMVTHLAQLKGCDNSKIIVCIENACKCKIDNFTEDNAVASIAWLVKKIEEHGTGNE